MVNANPNTMYRVKDKTKFRDHSVTQNAVNKSLNQAADHTWDSLKSGENTCPIYVQLAENIHEILHDSFVPY